MIGENLEHNKDLERIANFRLLDDEYMTKFFEKNNECVELVLRIILDDPSLKISEYMSQTQYVVKNLQGDSIRLDIHAIDDYYTEYDLEVQRADKGAGPRRARNISSLLDANQKAGEYGNTLTETYVIFITEKDIWKQGLPIYEIERYVNGIIPFNDGAHIIYVNGAYENNNTPIGKLMHDFRCKKSDEMFYSMLAARTKQLKETEEGVSIMCKELENMRNEATEKEKRANIIGMLKEGLNLDLIARVSRLTIEEVSVIGKQEALL